MAIITQQAAFAQILGRRCSDRGRISAWAAAWYNGGVTTNTAAHVGINGQLLSGAHSYRSAGVSGYIRQLLAHLPAAAPDLRLTAFTPDVDLDTELTLRRSTRWDTRQPLRRILWEQAALPLLARRAQLDLLHGTVNVNPALAPCPSVVTVHDLSFMRYPQAFPPVQRAYLQSQVRRSVRAARRVIAVSHATKEDVVELFGVSPERIDVVHNGVDASFCPAPTEQVEAFRRRQGLPRRYILHLGTLEPRKNLVRLVQAFAQVRANDPGQPPVKLVLAGGKGWSYDAIFAHCRPGSGLVVSGRRSLRLPISNGGLRATGAGGHGLRRAHGHRRHLLTARGGR